jgi:hypothetical protein
MKLKTLLFSVFALTCFFMQAQDWSSDVYKYGDLYPGYVILENGDKKEGFITYRNRYSMQNEVIFWKTKGDKKSKTKYKTGDLTEYLVADKLYKCIHYSGGLMKKPIKANLLVTDGCIAEFVWYDQAEGYLTMQKQTGESQEDFMKRMYPRTTVYLKAGSEEPKTTDYFALNFSKKMSEWISDDAALSQKVADKEKGYKMLAILDIIAQYNENCAK